jgi:hypothetical protein
MARMSVKCTFRAALASVIALVALMGAAQAADPTRLPVGDGNIAQQPRLGFVWPCATRFGGGGAQRSGTWLRGDGTFDFTAKPEVDGSVDWASELSVTPDGNRRRIVGNGLPNHSTGRYPVARGDDAYRHDRNPNTISAQRLDVSVPAAPRAARSPSCLPMGPIGVLLTGAVFFNSLDARGEDAAAHEIQDACQGHPERSGQYHYHMLSTCLEPAGKGGGHSPLVGYAFDGFGIFGRRGESGAVLSNADLGDCHGHSHEITWDGARTELFHYHATWEFPYTLGCYRGTAEVSETRQGPPPEGGPPPRGRRPPPGGGPPPPN